MELQTRPLSSLSMQAAADLFNRSFEGYFVSVQFTGETFKGFVQRDNIDFEASRMLLANGQLAGVALITCRQQASRLGGFGIISGFRGQGVGSWFTKQLLTDARQRGEERMFLEVITQNEYAVRLYEKHEFRRLRRLLGFKAEQPTGSPDAGLQSCGQDPVLDLIREHRLKDLPWQLDAETLSRIDSFGYQLREAYTLISDPGVEHISVRALVVPTQARGQGQAVNLLQTLFAKFPGKTWHVPAIFPEEMGDTFERADMQPEPLSQWQMVCLL